MDVIIGVVHGSRRHGHLRHCLDSLRRQTIPVRVVLLYDAGTRLDADCVRRVKLTHPEVEIHPVDYDASEGYCVSAVRNGLFDCLGDEEAIGWLDSDCLAAPNHAEVLLQAVRDNPQAVLACPRQRVEWSRDAAVWPELPGFRPADEISIAKTPEKMTGWLADGSIKGYLNCVGGCTGCRSDFAPRWDESYRGWGVEDEDWAMQMRRAGAVPVIGPVVYHQEHPVAEHKDETSGRNWSRFHAKFGTKFDPDVRCIVEVAPAAPELEVLVGVVHGSDRRTSLENCLRSLAEQTVPVRVVVLYDATSGRDDSVVHDLDVQVVPVNYDRSQGYCVSAVRNALLPLIGEERLVGWADSDIVFKPDAMQEMLSLLDLVPEATFACPRLRVSTTGKGRKFARGDKYGDLRMEKEQPDPTRDDVLAMINTGDLALCARALSGPAYFAGRDMLQPFDEAYRGWGAQDHDWRMTMLQAGAVPVLGPDVYHQEHEPEPTKDDDMWVNRARLWSKWPSLAPQEAFYCPRCGRQVEDPAKFCEHACEVADE